MSLAQFKNEVEDERESQIEDLQYIKRKKIIVIDDDYEMLKVIKIYFDDSDDEDFFEITYINSEIDGLETICNRQDYHLAILDINLQQINGFKIGSFIRSAFARELPIIYISSEKNKLKEFYARDQRNTYFMPKPFSERTFLAVVKEMLTYGL